jgi:two-component system CheB/CheR fusion protein
LSEQESAGPDAAADRQTGGADNHNDRQNQGGGALRPAYVVGVGASAGGLEALQTFFDHLPQDSGLGFVIIQHLSPDYKSLMAELLSKHTGLEVLRVEDGMMVESNKVYLIPPKKNMVVFHGKLLLTEQDHSSGLNLPIDIFFRSLAEDQGERSIGVVLSGTGSDGTRGVRAIKEAGGMVMVQDESAKFDGMPRSAINTGLADYILPPGEMGRQLVAFVKNPFISKMDGTGPTLMSEEDKLSKVMSLLRRETGVDFAYYKPSTVVRRIERRMGIAQFQDLDDYLAYLERSKAELVALYKDLLIGVTKFFRDREAFDHLAEKIVPELFKSAGGDKAVRAWVVGCSTGEEAYSVAMMLHEYRESQKANYDIKVFATDIDKDAIEFASQGNYPESIAADVPAHLLNRYFNHHGGGYRINREIRESVIFATHNILKDPPFTNLALITCRNLLIYLLPVLQKKVLSVFHFALNPNGFLFLGSSETVLDLNDEFRPFDAKWRMYIHRGRGYLPIKDTLNLPDRQARGERERVDAQRIRGAESRMSRPSAQDRALEQVAQRLITEFVPTCLVLNADNDLVHSFGRPWDLLKLPVGRASLNVLNMVPRELSLAISTAIHRARRSRETVSYTDVRIADPGGTRSVNLRVEYAPDANTGEELTILYIEEKTPPSPYDQDGESFDVGHQTDRRISDLEQDLQLTKENLQATIEELETSNEELQATNEELLAANEELQSTNEELQSVNEELHTVNAEHQMKILELTRLNSDMENLIRSTEIGTIFLDSRLQIREFTPAVTEEINILEQDVGRPFADLASRFTIDLQDHLQKVLDQGAKFEETVQSRSGAWYLIRILPYINEDREIDGVVITLVNITEKKTLLEALNQQQEAQRALLAGIPALVFFQDADLRYITGNKTFSELVGLSMEDIPGKTDRELFRPEEAEAIRQTSLKAMREGRSLLNLQENMTGADGKTRWYSTSKTPYFNDSGQVVGLVGIGWDISELKDEVMMGGLKDPSFEVSPPK